MPIYDIAGTIEIDFEIQVEAETEEAAIERVRMIQTVDYSNNTIGVDDDEAYLTSCGELSIDSVGERKPRPLKRVKRKG